MMKSTADKRKMRDTFLETTKQQAASALLAATFSYLVSNNISSKFILESARQNYSNRKGNSKSRAYERSLRAYEEMGTVMSAWFSTPKFLSSQGQPLPLTSNGGPLSVQKLVQMSRVKISASTAIELMQRSPSIQVDGRGNFKALKRVFFLPEFGVPRAALVMERYLNTLRKNSSAHKNGASLLLERNCHVPEIDLTRISPMLRDIKERGTAFMDSVDGDIEAHRSRNPRRKKVGELGVFVFAWTRYPKSKKSVRRSRVTA